MKSENQSQYQSQHPGALLTSFKNIALVGASAKPERPSYQVMVYLLEHGFNVFPVNPRLAGQQILGQEVYADLADIPHKIEVVDVFRVPAACPEIAEKAVRCGASLLWLQLGVISAEAEEIARAAGLNIVMDKCTKIEHAEYLLR